MSHRLRAGFLHMLFVVAQAFVCLMKAGWCHEPRKSLFTMDHIWFGCAGLAMTKKKEKKTSLHLVFNLTTCPVLVCTCIFQNEL